MTGKPSMIEIFTTGGTIDTIYFDALSEYQIGPTALPDILAENNVHVPHQVTQLMRKDSLDLTDSDRQTIRVAVLASNAVRFHAGVRRLHAVWSNFRIEQVYRTDALTMLIRGAVRKQIRVVPLPSSGGEER